MTVNDATNWRDSDKSDALSYEYAIKLRVPVRIVRAADKPIRKTEYSK